MKSLIALAIVLLTACTTGSFISTGTIRDSIEPDQVKIYADPPTQYETIGLVEASAARGIDNKNRNGTQRAIDELKKQAAQAGANGLLLTNIGETRGPDPRKTANGKAIYVQKE